jgi:uncharacterized repeat protein (TIGR01451 family)
MKRRLSVGLGILAVVIAVPFASGTPVLANLQQAGASIVKNIMQPKVQLKLGAEKQVAVKDAEGNTKIAWLPLKGSVTVQPGDVLRYTLTSENAGDKAANSLKLTQPVPAKTSYILKSARANGAKLTFSIDGGKTFVAQPMVMVKLANGQEELRPAPAGAYTHMRWDYSDSLAPLATVRAAYDVAVK